MNRVPSEAGSVTGLVLEPRMDTGDTDGLGAICGGCLRFRLSRDGFAAWQEPRTHEVCLLCLSLKTRLDTGWRFVWDV